MLSCRGDGSVRCELNWDRADGHGESPKQQGPGNVSRKEKQRLASKSSVSFKGCQGYSHSYGPQGWQGIGDKELGRSANVSTRAK